jgi:hypothetical protein
MPSRVKFPELPLVWLITVLFAIVEAFLWWMYNFKKWIERDSIAFLATITAGGFALFVYMKGVEEKKSQAADKLLDRWNNPNLADYKNIGRDIRRGIVDPLKLARTNPNDVFAEPEKTQRAQLLGLLGFFEEAALSVRMNTADEEKVRRFFQAAMTQTYYKVQGYVVRERNADNEQEYYIEFEKLVRKWEH